MASQSLSIHIKSTLTSICQFYYYMDILCKFLERGNREFLRKFVQNPENSQVFWKFQNLLISTKINYYHLSRFVEKNIFWLDVSVYYILRVQIHYSIPDLKEPVPNLILYISYSFLINILILLFISQQ